MINFTYRTDDEVLEVSEWENPKDVEEKAQAYANKTGKNVTVSPDKYWAQIGNRYFFPKTEEK